MKPVTIALREPVTFSDKPDAETVSELVLKPTTRVFKNFSIPMTGDGKIEYQPYILAAIGVKMAGKLDWVLDKMSVTDMTAVAQVVLGFLSPPES